MIQEAISKEVNLGVWQILSKATIGKDILELLSSSMYIEPLTIYREYVQNAIDSIDEARDAGLYKRGYEGRIDIDIDLTSRSIRIRDDGMGVRQEHFESQLGTFGSSLKRGTARRGFRGVGRLSGLGYCQSLIFRTRAAGDPYISEMLWDCKKVKRLLASSDRQWSLEDLLQEVVSVRQSPSNDAPTHFFEVELVGVIRHKNDVLLNRRLIYDYLSEVAPVPFHPGFSFGRAIEEHIADRVAMGNVEIHIKGEPDPVYRPFRDEIVVNGQGYDGFSEIEFVRLPALDDGDSGLMWLLHHSYKGAIPDNRIKGLRVRCGNIQIGNGDLLAESFVESRFNSWTVGEIHVIDSRLIPNGRRDHFELGVHFDNLLNQIIPHTRRIGVRCRRSSQVRNRVREIERLAAQTTEMLSVLEQGALNRSIRNDLLAKVKANLDLMTRSIGSADLEPGIRNQLERQYDALEAEFSRLKGQNRNADILKRFTKQERDAFQHIFRLIFDCSEDSESARILIDRILQGLQSSTEND